jgi:hypothetical protein
MLRLILRGSPAVASPPEPWIVLPFCSWWTGAQISPLLPTSDAQTALPKFFESTAYGGIDAYIRDCILRAYGSLRCAAGKQLVIDKTPPYHRVLPWLKRLFPEAKFIILRRHPLDVINSASLRWFGGDLRRCITERFDDMIEAPQRLAKLKSEPERQHIVQYESLVTFPETELCKLCTFLNLDYRSSMLEYGADREAIQEAARGVGDTFSSIQESHPRTSYAYQWTRSSLLAGLLEVARLYFPSEYWLLSGYTASVSTAATASALPGENYPQAAVEIQLGINALEYSRYGPKGAHLEPESGCSFTPATSEDHVATRFFDVPALSGATSLLVCNFYEVTYTASPAQTGRLLVQNDSFQTLVNVRWPLYTEGCSLPLALPRNTRTLRFVFCGDVGNPLPLPAKISIFSF